MKVAIVILAHNEAATIQSVVTAAAAFGSLIVVDDGSTDHTDQLAGEAGAQIVRHDHHRGYDAALQSGFEKVDALGMDIVVTLDADGQHDPNIIANLVAPLESGKPISSLACGRLPRDSWNAYLAPTLNDGTVYRTSCVGQRHTPWAYFVTTECSTLLAR